MILPLPSSLCMLLIHEVGSMILLLVACLVTASHLRPYQYIIVQQQKKTYFIERDSRGKGFVNLMALYFPTSLGNKKTQNLGFIPSLYFLAGMENGRIRWAWNTEFRRKKESVLSNGILV